MYDHLVVQACSVLETEIERAKALLVEAEARKAAAESRHEGFAERDAKQREELLQLQESLKELWTSRAVPSTDIMAFLRKLQMVLCCCTFPPTLFQYSLFPLAHACARRPGSPRVPLRLAHMICPFWVRRSRRLSASAYASPFAHAFGPRFEETQGVVLPRLTLLAVLVID